MPNVFLSHEVRESLKQVANAVTAVNNQQVEPSRSLVGKLRAQPLSEDAIGLVGELETCLGNAGDLLTEVMKALDWLLANNDSGPPANDGRPQAALVALRA